MSNLIKKIESCDFECEAGSLKNSVDWEVLVKKIDLWVITKRGVDICHTSGNDGWRFTVCTNRKEAEWLANHYNRENYNGEEICGIKHLVQ